MKLKKFILSLALFAFIVGQSACFAGQVPDSVIKNLVNQYKAHNYMGCIQSADKVLKVNPSNAYVHYYKGLSYVQLGKREEASAAFESVKTLNSSPTLVEFATRATSCLNNPEDCHKYGGAKNEMEEFIKSDKFYDKSVQTDVNKKKLERIRNNINDDLSGQKSEMPTNDEIANAVKTLAKLGLNPLASANPMSGMMQDPEMLQANMLLGNNNNQQNGMMNNMLPMLMMGQQNGQKIPPELIQSMMMSQMTPDFGGNSNTY